MIKKLSLLVAILTVWVSGLFAQPFDPMGAVPLDPEVRKGVLDNGLTYYIRHNAKPEKQAEFYIYHDVGAIQEEDSQQGLAHFLEHMAFNGTKNLPGKQLINWLESIGVKFGANLNAGTGVEMTVYMLGSVPITRESVIDSALLILHDWSYFIALEGDEIDNERGVIIEELRSGNTAGRRVRDKAMPYIYGDTRYANRNVIGHEDLLRTFDHQELRDFYHRWYRTDLQTLVIVGDFDVDDMEARVKRIMADIPAVDNPEPKGHIKLPGNEEPIVAVITDPELTNTSVTLYIKRDALPNAANELNIVYLQDVLDILASTIVNERFSDIAQKPNAPFIGANFSSGAVLTTTTDAVAASIRAREGEALKAFEAFYTELEKIARFGFTESEFERAKTEIRRGAQQQYDNRNDRRNSDFVWRYVEHFAANKYAPSAEYEWELDQKMLDFIELPMLNAFIAERLTPQNRIVLVNAPEQEGVSIPTADDVKAMMARVSAAELEAPADNTINEPLIPAGTKLKGSKVKKTTTDKFGATVWDLKNGIRVVVKPTDFKADEVLMYASANGGTSVLATEDIATATNLAGLVSQSGVGKFNASELRKLLAGKAVSLSPAVRAYSNEFRGSASPKDLETLMQLTYLSFTSPRFDRSDFDVMIDKMKASYANVSKNPQFVLQDSLTNTLYGHNPRRQIMSLERIGEIKFDRMQPIYNELFGNPDDFTFTIVGNVNLDELKPLIEKYLGSLPKTKKSFSWKDDGVRFAKGKIESVFAVPMQTPKTTVIFVLPGDNIPYSLENSLALNTLAQALRMRYTESIREEKGGTYGVSVQSDISYTPIDQYTMLISFDTNAEMADELMEIIFEEMDKVAEEGLRPDDLVKVKEYFAKQHPDNLKQNRHWANTLAVYYLTGHDMQSGYMDIVNGFTPEYFKEVMRSIRDSGNVIKIVMSDK